MKRFGELLGTAFLSVLLSLLAGAIVAGGYMRQVDNDAAKLKEMDALGTKALQAHVADNYQESKNYERRLSHIEIVVESLSDLKADVREIKVRVGDVQERQKRLEDANHVK